MQPHSTLPLFSLQPETKLIPLTQGMVAIVDAADYEWLSKWKWHAHKSRSQWYAVRWQSIDKKPCMIRMHRVIIDAPDGVIVDHINRISLDNRRGNLRLSNHRENQYNSVQYEVQHAGNSVNVTTSLCKRRKNWTVTITISGLLDKADAWLLRDTIAGFTRSRLD